jgi:hypothetical protein
MIIRKLTDVVHTVAVRPRLARLFWSERSLGGATPVTLTVESQWLSDGTGLELSVHTDEACTSEPLTTESLTVEANSAALEDWELTLPEDQPPPAALFFKVVCEQPELRAVSPALPLKVFELSI